MAQAVSEEHDWLSEDYVEHWIDDARVRDERRVPLLYKMVDYIRRSTDEALRVLDVGGGYGLVSQQVLEHFPRSTVVLHDYSEPMLARAKQRLAWAGDRVSYVKADLFDTAWNRAFARQFDAVVSAIAIHNLRDPNRIRGVYGEIFPLVGPGGCFLNYDRVPQTVRRPSTGGETATLENQLRWLREAGFGASDCLWRDMHAAILGGFRD